MMYRQKQYVFLRRPCEQGEADQRALLKVEWPISFSGETVIHILIGPRRSIVLLEANLHAVMNLDNGLPFERWKACAKTGMAVNQRLKSLPQGINVYLCRNPYAPGDVVSCAFGRKFMKKP